VPVAQVEGRVTRMGWRLEGDSGTTLQHMAPLRAQIAEAGYETLLDCETDGCGGFDFRFGIEVMPAPDMYVRLGDLRFL
jgi:OOP family OmpA-OmpF porin